MATFVFVHGGWHGAWCWSRVVPLLEARGHRTCAFDLPGCGRDKTPTAALTLDDYVNAVTAQLDRFPEPVNLVGHSSGGVVITQAAERRPDRIKNLIYLAAFLPKNGDSIMSLFQQAADSTLLRSIRPSDDQTHLLLPDEAVKDCFYEFAPAEYVALAKACLVPQPIGPGVTPVATTEANAGRVRRVYIETMRDRAIPSAFQKKMYTATPCERVLVLDSDHCPFFSSPEMLVEHLVAT